MHLEPLRQLLRDYLAANPAEVDVVTAFRRFVDGHPDCLHRTCREGHVTAAAWILSPDGGLCLLTLHRKLEKWLQLGGHVDGEEHVWRAALREAREESGMNDFTVLTSRPLDLDIHRIPAHGNEPAHLHLDVRFLLRAAPGQTIACSAESLQLGWFHQDRLAAVTSEECVLRMARKAKALSFRDRSVDNLR